MQTVNRKALLVAACGAAVCASALAGPKVINISGATLLESFVAAPASTNDFIDVDGNLVAGKFSSFPPQNLTPVPGVNQVSPFPGNQVWATTYRVSGSVNGVTELARFGNVFVTNSATGSELTFSGASRSYYNGAFLYHNGSNLAAQPVTFNSANPGGMPIRSDTTTLDATYSVPGVASAGGVRIDIAPCDVPGLWVPRIAGSTNASKKPGQAGYGAFSRRATAADGTGSGIDSRLPDLSALGLQFADPNNLPPPSATGFLFNNSFAFAPIAATVNFGVGRQQIKQSELRHLFVTGRMPDGENLVAVTRDIGSGTRNAFMNSIAADPSFGAGDNISSGTGTSANTVQNRPGLAFVPNNKGGNDRVEETVYSTRLAIGYVGPERGAASASVGTTGNWLANGRMEVLAIQNDLQGGTAFARPNIDSMTEGDVNNYTIGGPAQLITLGSPLAEPIAAGGLGLNTVKMFNPNAAAYMNNVRQSIENFLAIPFGSQSEFMPGEIAALQFVLTSAIEEIHDNVDPMLRVNNTSFNSSLRAQTRATNALSESIFYSFNTTSNGIVPARIVAANTYSDQGLVPSGANYISQGGAAVAYSSSLTTRNKIAGDFDGNGSRGLGDIAEMLKAFRQRNGGPVWTAPGVNGSNAVIEILGDFDNNGSFNRLDVRYFADGLLLVGGVLRRDTAFTEVDSQWNTLTGSDNFFSTTLATAGAGATYTSGASRADIKGAAGIARGWAPVGANGVIDATDIDYIYAQFKSNAAVTGDADWSNIDEAGTFDLSADMDGNLKVNQADVDYVVLTALQTSYGDLNFDRKVTGADFAIWQANYNTAGGWVKGDVSGNGLVFDEDFNTLMANRSCAADVNDDTFVDDTDFVVFAAAYNDLLCPALPGLCPADLNNDTFVDDTDFVIFAEGYNALLCP
jgi:hypothetical protein